MTSPFLFEQKTLRGFGLLSAILAIMVLSISVIGVIQLVAPALMTRNGRITVNRMDAIRSAVTTYKSHHGGTTRPSVLAHLVTTDGGAACAIDNNTASATYKSLQGWCGPYLDVVFQEFATEYKTDGWGTEFRWVQATGALTSCGSNRTCGDSDDIAYTL